MILTRVVALLVLCLFLTICTKEDGAVTGDELTPNYIELDDEGYATATSDIGGNAFFISFIYQQNLHIQVFDKYRAKGIPELFITVRETASDQIHIEIKDPKNRLEPMVYHGNPLSESPNTVLSLVEDNEAYLIPPKLGSKFHIRVEKETVDEFGTDFVSLIFFTVNRHDEYTPALELGGAVVKVEEFHMDTLTSLFIEDEPTCLSLDTSAYFLIRKALESNYILTMGFNTLSKSKHGIVGAWYVNRLDPNLTQRRFSTFLNDVAKKHLLGPYREEKFFYLEKYSLPATKKGYSKVAGYHLGFFGAFMLCDATTDVLRDEWIAVNGNSNGS